MNLSDLRRHPAWLLAVAMVHHPLLSAVGAAGAAVAIVWYARWARLPLAAVADCLAAPVALGMAAEQVGALLAGSDFGRDALSPAAWTVTYTSPLAAHWSGTPLGVPLYPVQAYAALGALLLAAICLGWMFSRIDVATWRASGWSGRQSAVRDRDLSGLEGRGVLLAGRVDIPQLVGLGMVVCGGLLLWTGIRQVSPQQTRRKRNACLSRQKLWKKP